MPSASWALMMRNVVSADGYAWKATGVVIANGSEAASRRIKRRLVSTKKSFVNMKLLLLAASMAWLTPRTAKIGCATGARSGFGDGTRW